METLSNIVILKEQANGDTGQGNDRHETKSSDSESLAPCRAFTENELLERLKIRLELLHAPFNAELCCTLRTRFCLSPYSCE